ncbi:hypothetical protein ACFQXB_02925 [Plastorhodobacter daqingensis]|uniref:Uncharacterized protein n=1 Tax=Plastorhodobacter daqingensis TaxID=1387281 RepID=A0ABW2UGQ5_9RHOB
MIFALQYEGNSPAAAAMAVLSDDAGDHGDELGLEEACPQTIG